MMPYSVELSSKPFREGGRLEQLVVLPAELLLELVPFGDFPLQAAVGALQLFGTAQGQGLRHQGHQGQDGAPGDERGQQLDGPGQAVQRREERDHLHEVGEAAGDDEGPEHPEHPGERQVAASAREKDQHDRDGQVGQPDEHVRGGVEPDQLLGPAASEPAGGHPGRCKEVEQGLPHG